jgi:hypothetical protein
VKEEYEILPFFSHNIYVRPHGGENGVFIVSFFFNFTLTHSLLSIYNLVITLLISGHRDDPLKVGNPFSLCLYFFAGVHELVTHACYRNIVIKMQTEAYLLLHLKMKMAVMEGWPAETVFFSSVFLSFFPWSSFRALLVCTVLVHFPSLSSGFFMLVLLLLTVAAAQVTEIHAATNEKRRLLLEIQGCN